MLNPIKEPLREIQTINQEGRVLLNATVAFTVNSQTNDFKYLWVTGGASRATLSPLKHIKPQHSHANI